MVSLALLVSWVAAVVVTPLVGNCTAEGAGRVEARTRSSTRRFYRGLRALRRLRACASLVVIARRWRCSRSASSAWRQREAVLPVVEPRRADGRAVAAGGRQHRGHRGARPSGSRRSLASDPDVAHLRHLRGLRLAALLPVARPAAVPHQLRPAVVLDTRTSQARERVFERVREAARRELPRNAAARVQRVPLGPPVRYPVEFRVIGPDSRSSSSDRRRGRGGVRAHTATRSTRTLDWGDAAPALRIEIDQDTARAVGLSAQDVARTLQARRSRLPVGHVPRGRQADRHRAARARGGAVDLPTVRDLKIQTRSGQHRAAGAGRRVRQVLRGADPAGGADREPTLTVRADIVDGVQAPGRRDRDRPDARSRSAPRCHPATASSSGGASRRTRRRRPRSTPACR